MSAVKKCASISAVAAAGAVIAGLGSYAHGAATLGPSTWTSTGTGTTNPAPADRQWNNGANWSTNPDHPSGINASAIFTGGTANRSIVYIDNIVLGSLSVDNNTNFSTTLTGSAAGGGGSLTFDVTTGSASLTVNGTGGQTNTAGNLTVQSVVLNDNLIATVNQTNAASAAGGLQFTGEIQGTGGLTKAGDGLATLSNAAKLYTGPTLLSGGRTRLSTAGMPTGTSSFTIGAGAQLTMISNNGTYTFGGSAATPLNLNGTGATSGPFAVFPGAIRNNTDLAATITNVVDLQSDTLIHVEGAASGSVTFTGVVGGIGELRLTAPSSSANQGQLVLGGTAANTYSGGTLVAGGMLVANKAGALGTGDVTVSDATSTDSVARLNIAVDDAIADLATLSLAGGGAAGSADENFAILASGVNDTVGGLILGGVAQTQIGTYGSSASGADFQSDEYFSGLGVVTLVPEPTCLALLGLGAAGLLARRRRAV